jgi:hypothetical protein
MTDQLAAGRQRGDESEGGNGSARRRGDAHHELEHDHELPL